jgi:nucleoside-diphosphate-sugar epimerase
VKCLVTGANGFIGTHLVRYLLDAGHEVRAVDSLELVKVTADERLENVQVAHSAVDPATWQAVCRDMEVVFHLAGRVHRGDNSSPSERAIYFRENLEMTRALAEGAMKARVRRFVFASSVTVFGAVSAPGEVFREDSPPAPHPGDVYAQSKQSAEGFLLSDVVRTSLEAVVVRLPLVYGVGVKANMAALARLARSGLPLPLAGIDNRRSFINIPNCVDFLFAAASHPDAHGRVLLASDREDVSTPDLIRLIAHASGKTARLFSMPSGLLKTACSRCGQGARFERLASNVQSDPTASCALLDWSPKTSLVEGVAQMCAKDGEM